MRAGEGASPGPGGHPASRNAGQLAGLGENDDRLGGWLGRLGPAAMVGAFELVAAHLAFDRAGVGAQSALGQLLGEDLRDRPADRAGGLVRGKTPRGWPGG